MSGNAVASPAPGPATPAAGRPLGGVAVGVALVLLAVLVGAVAQRASDGGAGSTGTIPAGASVPATGHTTTVEVTARGMRFHPDHIQLPLGDRLVIVLRNAGDRRHDLVLANGARTGLVPRGGTARLDAGVIGRRVDGWCSVPGHRQAGMTLTITTTGASTTGGMDAMEHNQVTPGPPAGNPASPSNPPRVDPMADPGPAFTARDATLRPAPTSRVRRITLRVEEVELEVAPGVRQTLWTFNGTAPGPVLRGRVGDVFEVTLVNSGHAEHGLDFHAAALAPDRAFRPIDPGQRSTVRFTATRAGVWMYHCSAEPMLYHIGNGMYGALVIDPPDLAPVDREYLLVQSEFYLGPQGQPGDVAKMRAEQPDAVVFNGYVSQYAHRPLPARVGERVRVWLLDAGPSRATSLHIVGTQFDAVYAEGAWRLRPGGASAAQVLDLTPGAGGFVETVFTEPGRYPFLSHVMVDADRGARGAFAVTG